MTIAALFTSMEEIYETASSPKTISGDLKNHILRLQNSVCTIAVVLTISLAALVNLITFIIDP